MLGQARTVRAMEMRKMQDASVQDACAIGTRVAPVTVSTVNLRWRPAIYSPACAGYFRIMLRPMDYKRTAIRNRPAGRGLMRARPD